MAVFQRIAQLFAAGESRNAVRRELAGTSSTPDTAVDRGEGESPLALSRRYPMEVAGSTDRLQSREIERLLTAMMVRDRDLAAMHRELLELLEKLIHALASVAGARAPDWRQGGWEAAIPPGRSEPAPAPPAADRAATPPESVELERLRDSLARERETVERLRRARMELEQRLTRLEKEERGKKGR